MAPAAGPGWEEPTSQSYRKFLSGSDYVFTLSGREGSAYDGLSLFPLRRAIRFLSRHVGTCLVVWRLPSSSHLITRFCALSRYGVIRSVVFVFLPVLENRDQASPAHPMAGRLRARRARFQHPPSDFSDSERCREMFLTNRVFSIIRKKAPMWSELLGRFA